MTEERRPLVIIGVGGGLVQWEVLKPGTGTPRLHVLDYDREGEPPEETADFADRIEEAIADLAEYGDPEDIGTLDIWRSNVAEYRDLVSAGETPGRYR